MKKSALIFVMAFALCLGLTSCGNTSNSSNTQASSQASSGTSMVSSSYSSVSTQSAAASAKPVAKDSADMQTSSSAGSNATDETTTHSETGTATSSAITMKINDSTLAMTLADTEAASALATALQDGPISVDLHSYGGFEKVGPLPQALPTSDRHITTEPGDVMLYQGNQITIFHGSNTWAYTPLGRIEDATAESLLAAFGDGDATVVLSL